MSITISELENFAARPYYDNDGIRELMAAICLRAAVDYKRASMGYRPGGRDPWRVMRECEVFFESELFQTMSQVRNVEKIKEKILAIPDEYADHIRLLQAARMEEPDAGMRHPTR